MEKEYDKAYAYAMRLLGFRQQSTAEMQQKLVRKGFSGSVVNDVMADLRASGFLNDSRFAQDLIRSIERRKPAGRAFVQAKFRDYGIADDVGEKALAEELPEEKEYELALELARDKVAEFRVKLDKISTKQKAKIMRYLSGRGFNAAIVRDVLDELEGRKRW